MLVKIKGAEHPVDPSKLSFGEAKRLEQLTGQTFTTWSGRLTDGSMTALASYALVLLQRTDPSARMSDIDKMGIHELEWIEEDSDREARERAEAGMTAEQPPYWPCSGPEGEPATAD